MSSYSAFGPYEGFADLLGEGYVWGGELGDGEELTVEQAHERIYAGMLGGWPVGLIAGEAATAWDHVAGVARALLGATAGKKMRLYSDADPEWMGLVIETSLNGSMVRNLRNLCSELGEADRERLVVVYTAGALEPQTMSRARRLVDGGCGVIVELWRYDKTQVAAFHRLLERRRPGAGRGLRLLDAPRGRPALPAS